MLDNLSDPDFNIYNENNLQNLNTKYYTVEEAHKHIYQIKTKQFSILNLNIRVLITLKFYQIHLVLILKQYVSRRHGVKTKILVITHFFNYRNIELYIKSEIIISTGVECVSSYTKIRIITF